MGHPCTPNVFRLGPVQPLYLPQVVLRSGDTPKPPRRFTCGPSAAPIPAWVGLAVWRHPYTPTKFVLGPADNPNTSFS